MRKVEEFELNPSICRFLNKCLLLLISIVLGIVMNAKEAHNYARRFNSLKHSSLTRMLLKPRILKMLVSTIFIVFAPMIVRPFQVEHGRKNKLKENVRFDKVVERRRYGQQFREGDRTGLHQLAAQSSESQSVRVKLAVSLTFFLHEDLRKIALNGASEDVDSHTRLIKSGNYWIARGQDAVLSLPDLLRLRRNQELEQEMSKIVEIAECVYHGMDASHFSKMEAVGNRGHVLAITNNIQYLDHGRT